MYSFLQEIILLNFTYFKFSEWIFDFFLCKRNNHLAQHNVLKQSTALWNPLYVHAPAEKSSFFSKYDLRAKVFDYDCITLYIVFQRYWRWWSLWRRVCPYLRRWQWGWVCWSYTGTRPRRSRLNTTIDLDTGWRNQSEKLENGTFHEPTTYKPQV